MAIKGFTDRPAARWDGKIRGGYKQTESSAPTNTPHFLLHDAPGLDGALGEKPKEIFVALLYDDPEAVAKMDLRWYKKNDLVCQGNGETAAYFATGDYSGVKQVPAVFRERNFMGQLTERPIPRSRERQCRFTQCPDFIERRCRKHLYFTFAIPQFSMASLFTLDSVSDYTMNSVIAALDKAKRNTAIRRKPMKVSGEIFRVYKQKEDVKFMDPKSGKRFDSEKDVTLVEWVPFELYEKDFKSKVTPHEWDYLIEIREGGLRLPGMEYTPHLADEIAQIAATVNNPQITGPVSATNVQQLEAPDPEKDLNALKARANHESALPYFEELAQLTGKSNTEEIRLATAKMFPDISQLVDALKKKLAKLKKEAKAKLEAQAPTTPPVGAAKTPEVLPPEGLSKAPIKQPEPQAAASGGIF